MFFAGSFILDLAEFASERKLKYDDIVALSGVSEEQLKQPGFLVGYSTIERVFYALKQLPESDFIGLEMGEQINLRATAFVDQLMDSCKTVQQAFEYAVAYSRLISDSMQCTLDISEDRFEVRFDLHPEWSLCDDFAIRQNLDLALICAQNSLTRLTSTQYFPTRVNLHYPKPRKPREYFRRFNCAVRFNQEYSSIEFNRHLLNKRATRANRGLREELRLQANQLIDELPEQDPWWTSLQTSILHNLSESDFAISAVSRDLNLSPRTLQRRLNARGKTFKEVQNELRYPLIGKLMEAQRYSLDEVAWMVGYADAGNLIRAFKKRTGHTPGKFYRPSKS